MIGRSKKTIMSYSSHWSIKDFEIFINNFISHNINFVFIWGPFARFKPFEFSREPRMAMGWKINSWFFKDFEKIVKTLLSLDHISVDGRNFLCLPNVELSFEILFVDMLDSGDQRNRLNRWFLYITKRVLSRPKGT